MPHYAVLQIRKVEGNPLSPDQIVEEMMRAQSGAEWGHDAKLVKRADAPKAYDEALSKVRARCKKAKETVEVLDEREMLIRVTERRRYRNTSKRPPKKWTGFLRVVEVDVTPRLIERVGAALAPKFIVKGGLITP